MLEMSSIHGPRNITHQLLCSQAVSKGPVSQQPPGELVLARGQQPKVWYKAESVLSCQWWGYG